MSIDQPARRYGFAYEIIGIADSPHATWLLVDRMITTAADPDARTQSYLVRWPTAP